MRNNPDDTAATGRELLSAASLRISAEDPGTADALLLQHELGLALAALTGDTGQSSFSADDVRVTGALFVLARDRGGRALGCAALRPLQPGEAELKRMYARPGTQGVGAALLRHLEVEALALGYSTLRLSTRRVNLRAVAFYEAHGYRPCAPYGRYVGRPESCCLAKHLAQR